MNYAIRVLVVDDHDIIRTGLAKILEYDDIEIIGEAKDGFEAIKKASLHNAYGAHYIENILYQEMTPKKNHPPVKVKHESLNHIRLQQPSLAQYDAFVIRRRKNDD